MAKAAIEAGFLGLVIVACVGTAISIYYYLRPVVVMFTGESAKNKAHPNLS